MRVFSVKICDNDFSKYILSLYDFDCPKVDKSILLIDYDLIEFKMSLPSLNQ